MIIETECGIHTETFTLIPEMYMCPSIKSLPSLDSIYDVIIKRLLCQCVNFICVRFIIVVVYGSVLSLTMNTTSFVDSRVWALCCVRTNVQTVVISF